MRFPFETGSQGWIMLKSLTDFSQESLGNLLAKGLNNAVRVYIRARFNCVGFLTVEFGVLEHRFPTTEPQTGTATVSQSHHNLMHHMTV